MKSEIKPEEAKFRPVSLVITMETKEEWHILREMMGMNDTVPSALKKNSTFFADEDKNRKLRNIMGDLFETLKQVNA